MWAGIITLFPESFNALKTGVTGKAIEEQHLSLQYFNPRHYATGTYLKVDDKVYGGGPGMLMKTEPLTLAINAAKAAAPKPAPVIYLSPQGKPFTQRTAERFAALPALIMVAGRYEGIDQRVIDQTIDEEWTIGDYILTGGELPAMVVLDAVARLLPTTLGNAQSAVQDSLNNDLLKYPQYTRPAVFNEKAVPDILLSGHHQAIDKWRLKQALGTTWRKRPDLLIKRGLSQAEYQLLMDYLDENEA